MTAWCDHLDAGVVTKNWPKPERRRIAYYKLGRSLLLDPKGWGPVGGDNEPLTMLLELARRYPEVDWVVAGRHSRGDADLPSNVLTVDLPRGNVVAENIEIMDEVYGTASGAVMWLGQHGTTNMPTPQLSKPDVRTYPLDESLIYCGPMLDGLNRAGPPEEGGYEPVWLCADARNYLKARDLKWHPRKPILSQYEWSRDQRHFRWYDSRTPDECGYRGHAKDIGKGHWASTHKYVAAGLELTGVPRWELGAWAPWSERDRFGVIINEARGYVTLDRASITRDWIVPCDPSWIYGKWSAKGMEIVGRDIEPIHYTTLHETFSHAKSTFTTPSSGSRWATAKPWEAFALGVICFFHPAYDDQGHIVPTREQARDLDEDTRTLVDWLRPQTPDELKQRVDAVDQDNATYQWLVWQQWRLLEKAREEDRCYHMIADQLGLEYRR